MEERFSYHQEYVGDVWKCIGFLNHWTSWMWICGFQAEELDGLLIGRLGGQKGTITYHLIQGSIHPVSIFVKIIISIMYKYKCMHQLLKLKNIIKNMIKKTHKIVIYMYIVYLKAEFENRIMFNCSCGRLNIHYSENFLIVRKCHLYAPGDIICS